MEGGEAPPLAELADEPDDGEVDPPTAGPLGTDTTGGGAATT